MTAVRAADLWRDPADVVSLVLGLPSEPSCFEAEADAAFVEALAVLGITLLVSREYEHLVLALSAGERGLAQSVLRAPHPSGIAVDRDRGRVVVACTRNPNQLLELAPAGPMLERSDAVAPADASRAGGGPLVPVGARFLPGCAYLHDLAFVGGRLVGNAVGMNAVVDLDDRLLEPLWWPASVDVGGRPRTDRNLLQLNSIAAGPDLAGSYFTASVPEPGDRRPGDPAWVVDRRGVVFSGTHREPYATGLTRPHSARLDERGRLWVDDSGYGRLCCVEGGRAVEVTTLPGWTRGLCTMGELAFVGTSRILPGFERYAPGVDPAGATCGVHLVDLGTGQVLGGVRFPSGDQIFAIDWLPSSVATGFLGGDPGASREDVTAEWYRYGPPLAPPRTA